MTNQPHPITPPFELMNQWYKKACKDPYNGGKFIMSQVLKDICTAAAQWGADQELEACVKWIEDCGYHPSVPEDFRAARRPKPPSLKEQALEALDRMDQLPTAENLAIIREALEAL